MGTWGSGPFENDGAADFVGDARTIPAASIAEALLAVADAKPGDYIDVDDGQRAVAASELVALGYGYGKLDGLAPDLRQLVKTLGPNEALRVLSLRALPRILGELSELAELWEDDDEWASAIADLIARLTEAGD